MTEDGLRGPAGERFAQALAIAGQRLEIDVRGVDRVSDFIGSMQWINQQWRGRGLKVGVATYGAQAVTSGYRWIVVRLETKVRLGLWADPAMRSNSPLEGVGLPVTLGPVGRKGVWTDQPSLSEDLGTFAATMAEGSAVLQVRNDCVLWQLKASELDGDRLSEAISLLDRVAAYAETHDAALSARLGRAEGATGWRAFEIAYLILVIGTIAAIIAGVFILTALF